MKIRESQGVFVCVLRWYPFSLRLGLTKGKKEMLGREVIDEKEWFVEE